MQLDFWSIRATPDLDHFEAHHFWLYWVIAKLPGQEEEIAQIHFQLMQAVRFSSALWVDLTFS